MATNGLTPPSLPAAPSSPSIAKRKRPDADSLLNGASTKASTPRSTAGRPLQAVLEDILEDLRSYDTSPSILDRPIASAITRDASGEANSKRTKLASSKDTSTISDLVQAGSYGSLEDLEKDGQTASEELLATIQTDELTRTQPSAEDTLLQTRILGFRQRLRHLIDREKRYKVEQDAIAESTTEEDTTVEETVQVKAEEQEPEGRPVLTLFGSAGPKQLFSSLQQPQKVFPTKNSGTGFDASEQVIVPLRESSLPNIISTTDVFPLPDVEDVKKKSQTFKDVFVRSKPKDLSPPKTARPLTTRDNTITFVQPDALPKPGRKSSHSYTTQNLSTGTWLGYGGVDMPKDITSPTAKQKSRQRALSTGEAQLPPSETVRAAVQQAKEDALFRSAFSSFCPTRDDAAAIIPEETKKKLWWQYVGEKRFNETFPIDPTLLDMEDTQHTTPKNDSSNELDGFKKAVEDFDSIDESLPEPEEKSDLDKDTEEILKEVSDLIDTLASHQRIRNSSLSTNPRTPVIQNPSLASLAGSPTSPSEEEVDVYQILKSQLTLLIAQLPPYAVAKLNGEQLEELNISRTILIETKNYKGVLEDDHASRLAKSAAFPAAATPSLTRMGSSGNAAHAHYPGSSTQYARPPAAYPPNARPGQTPQSYYSQQAPLQRSPSITYPRSSSGPNQAYQTPAAAYGGSSTRQGYPATQVYGQQTPRTTYPPTTPGQFYPQRGASSNTYGAAANSQQYYQSTPQSRYPAQSATNGYYQRPQNVAPGSGYGGASMHSGSPLKANPSLSQSSYNAPRPQYGTPVGNTQMRNSYFGQPGIPASSQYGTPQPPTPSTGAPAAYGSMGSNHQQMLLDRQQSQHAAQSQARMAAQNSFNRQGSGTPQPPASQTGAPPHVNGSSLAV